MTKFSFYLIASLALMGACTDDPADGAHSGAQPNNKPEYSYTTVGYSKWSSGGIFGDWSTQESSETRTIAGMNWLTPVDFYVETPWGGRLDYDTPSVTIGKEGFFRVAKSNNRWYFLDPNNGAMIIRGTQHVNLPETSETEHINTFNAKFGSNNTWSKETGELLSSYGFNYISYGAKRIERFPDDVRDNLLKVEDRKVAYAENLYLLRSFMWDMYADTGASFEEDTYSRFVLIYDDRFKSKIATIAQNASAQFAGDEHFIGYYLDNELGFSDYNRWDRFSKGIDIKDFLALPDRYRGAREVAEKFMTDNNIADANHVTLEHREAFRDLVTKDYFQFTTEAVRAADPNRLILGVRLHDSSKYVESIVKLNAEYCDVVSINYYHQWQPEDDYLNNLAAWIPNKPFIITEFYVKGNDAEYNGEAYGHKDGGGWLVNSQEDRGKFYQNFVIRLLEGGHCAGWMHFEYIDNWSGASQASNKGVVSVAYQPYTPFLESMKDLHNNIYPIIDYYDNKQ